MSFVSYAQNFEDVMLWRALKHIEGGFYVDIGAQDPIVDSVSLAFYEHGWRGVHVEPTQQYSKKLRIARPDETVLQVAIGNRAGTMTFYEFEDTGLSTADPDIARKHQDAGFRCNEALVPVISLDTLFERIDVNEIHWLKLDVEGFEKDVLESWKNSSILPWLLTIESTRPLTQEESYDEWEQLLLNKGYRHVYSDGLNRFYLSPQHDDLVRAFSSPPNIFDGFVLSGSASHPFYKLVESKAQEAESKAQEAESKAQEAESKAQEAESKAQEAERKAQEADSKAQEAWAGAEQARSEFERAHAQLIAVSTSTSWRITKPLRWTVDHFRDLRQLRLQLRLRQLMKLGLLSGIRLIGRHPRMKRSAILLATRLGFVDKLHRMYSGQSVPALFYSSFPEAQLDLEDQSAHVRRIFADLKVAIEAHKEADR
jgi:FkbM family methyltransferase